MSSRKERRAYRAFLILFCCLLVSKGWFLSILAKEPKGSTCLAAQASAEAEPSAAPTAPCEETFRQKLAGLIQDVQKEKERIQQKARALDEKEGRLDIYRKELDDRVEQLKRVRAEIEKMYQVLDQGQQDREQKIVKIYESMEPESAARGIEAMDEEISSWLIEKMNPRQSSQILGAMNPQRASRLTTRLGRKPQVSEK
jgi:flagellar motility protein MotE (MotC chaperone)